MSRTKNRLRCNRAGGHVAVVLHGHTTSWTLEMVDVAKRHQLEPELGDTENGGLTAVLRPAGQR